MKTLSKPIKVNYEVKKGDETERHDFKLPVSKGRYTELATGLNHENKTWHEVKEVLTLLAKLQNSELGCWSLELVIKTEDD